MKLKRVFKWGAAVVSVTLVVTVLAAYARSSNECYDGTTPTPTTPIKAVIYCDYGAPDVLKIVDVEKPVPDSGQVLVRVRAAAINPLEWHYMRGTPYLARIEMGLRKPKNTRLGVDYSGVVESIGKGVTQFKPGDEVFGGRIGALAQYVAAREDGGIALKPANLTFEQAAAVQVAGLTALQGLRDGGKIQPGQKVLINGASGGVGTFAVQIAKSFGAHVTGVNSTRNVELVRSLGADRVIDYTREDFTKGAERYDLILDNVGNHSLSDLRHVLNPNGRLVMIGGPSGRWVDPLPRVLGAVVTSWFVSQDLRFFLSHLDRKDLGILAGLMEAGKVTPVIDRTYKLEDVRVAMKYLETGRARGKVVITMD